MVSEGSHGPDCLQIIGDLHPSGPAGQTNGRGSRNTRSAVALELWRPYLDGAVVAIGNARPLCFTC